MGHSCRIAVAATTALTLWLSGQGALAQKSGGVLKMPDFASPASMSIHEEVTRAAITVLMPVFNNLVLFDQHRTGRGRHTILLVPGNKFLTSLFGIVVPQVEAPCPGPCC